MHMGLQLLTVALEAAYIAPYQSLLVLVKDELCRHLFQVGHTLTHTHTHIPSHTFLCETSLYKCGSLSCSSC